MKTALKLILTSLIFVIPTCGQNHGTMHIKDIAISQNISDKSGNVLPIPPVLKNKSKIKGEAIFNLSIKSGTTEFFKGKPVNTYGYNGSLLGPTIRVKKGEKVSITVKNNLYEYSTVHWHGMLVPGKMDGGPHQVVAPGKKWNASFTVNQPASTAWYHPHGLGTTAVQVYKGLAGLLIVDDENSNKLNIPNSYGVNDIPLIVQDRRFSDEGALLYLTSMRDTMGGMKGNTILVNGVINSFLKVTGSKYRFRILNGSNARVYNFKLSNNQEFYQIATDGGFLEKAVKRKSLKLSPGERAEIIIDFSHHKKGDSISLKSGYFNITTFKIGNKVNDKTEIPENLAKIDFIPTTSATRNRVFNLEGMGHRVSINRKQMNINRIDEYVKYNSVETWTITSSTRGMMGMGMMMGGRDDIFHNFHAHGVQFLILSRNGNPPPDYERGWKDTMLLDNNEYVKIITRFLYRGIFMYHCHILEHEDNGMMGQFKVE